MYLRSVLAHLPVLPPEELQDYLPDAWMRDLMGEQRAALNAYHAAMTHAKAAGPSDLGMGSFARLRSSTP